MDTPLKYKEIFEILNKNGIISKNVSNVLGSFIYQRNMIAHQYGKIKLEKVYEVLEKKEIFLKYIEEVLLYLKSKN